MNLFTKHNEVHMKLIAVLTALLLCVSLRATAGEMYGAITDGERSVGEKIKVEVTVAGKTYAADTDKNGAYRLIVKEKGKGVFTVHYKDQAVTADVFSYDKSLRYDWTIEHKDGKMQLKRK
jgi:hypothetical protein